MTQTRPAGVKPRGWGALRAAGPGCGSRRPANWVVAVCMAVGVVVAAPGVAAATTVNGSITMIGAQGDYIAGGSQYLFDAPGANAMSGNAGTVVVNTPSPAGAVFGYTMNFAAPTGSQLSVGEYDNAERYPFESAGHPGLSIWGDGRGCNEDFGWFIIKDIHLDGGGNVDRFWALYEQHCEGSYAPPLFGEVRLGEPARSAAEVVEPASINWPMTSIGTTGIHVPVTVTAGGGGADITSAAITGANPGDFKIGTDECTGTTLAAGNNCRISVAVAPTVPGDRHATLAITDSLGSTTDVPLDYLPLAYVTSLSSSASLPAGGASVTIHGSQFSDVSAVRFGSASASFVIDSPTHITATVPAGPPKTSVDVLLVNGHGDSGPSSVTRFTYAGSAPSAPKNASATAGDGQASVSFAGPDDDGGSPVTRYTVTASPGGAQGSGTTSPITVRGLSDGSAYTFSVTATNAVGTSPASVSNSITTLKTSGTAINFSPDHAAYGTPITLGATVTSAFAGVPTGTVTFQSGNGYVGQSSLDANGKANSGPVVTPDVGASVTARYLGDGAFKSSTSTVTPAVVPAVTTTSLSSTANPTTPNSTITLTATVRNDSSDAVPNGQVQFLVNGKTILAPQPLDPFAAPAIDAQLPAGTYRFTAQYMPPQSPGPDFTSSSGSVTEVVAVPTYTPPPPATSTVPPPSTSGGTVPDSSFFLGEPVVARDGTIVLSAQSRQAGRFSYSAKRVRGHGPVIYGTGSRTSNGRNPTSLVIRPTASARNALTKYGTMTVRVTVTFTSGRGGSPRRTVLTVTVHHRVTKARSRKR